MRILFTSAFYPPFVTGGWEQLLENVNSRLRARGHETFVLTSNYGLAEPASDGDVARILHLESDLQNYQPRSFLSQGQRLRENLASTEAVIDAFRPDVVFVQNLWNLSRGVPWTAEQRLPGRVAYYMPSVWAYPPDTRAAYWESPAADPLRGAAKRLFAPIPLRAIRREHDRFRLRFDHILCVSDASRQAVAAELGRDPATMRVVHNGIEPDLFCPRSDWGQGFAGRGMSVLFAGTVAQHKGVHTAVEAMAALPAEANGGPVTLAIVGSGNVEYEDSLRQRVAALGLGERVVFHGRVPREAMPDLMRRFDVLVLPSIWEEPLARVMLEAMASGLVVVGTTTGGTGEVLVDGQTGLVFAPGDAAALTRCLAKIAAEPDRSLDLSKAARERILADFTLERMVDEIERALDNVIRSAA